MGRRALVLLVALLLAGVAAFAVYTFIQDYKGEIDDAQVKQTVFRATQAEEKLRRDNIKGKAAANRTHHEVGAKVRQTIRELGGVMPEELPAEESIKKIERKHRKPLGITEGNANPENE